MINQEATLHEIVPERGCVRGWGHQPQHVIWNGVAVFLSVGSVMLAAAAGLRHSRAPCASRFMFGMRNVEIIGTSRGSLLNTKIEFVCCGLSV